VANRVALVTGGSRGLGKSMVVALAEMGHQIYFTYNTDEAAAAEVHKDLLGQGHDVVPLHADLATRPGLDDFLQSLPGTVGPVDILVNNAGAIFRPGGWQEQPDDALYNTFELNLIAPLRLIQALGPVMAEGGYGRIVNITSTYAITGAAAVLSYTTAKAGLISLTYAMARELGSKGVTVNAIAPGNFDTDMTRAAGPDMIDFAERTTPLGRLGRPSEVADALRFLVASEFITGHVLVVDGGQLLNL
jgi:3-oxoacyl-[acyl-carrier protein] reductase